MNSILFAAPHFFSNYITVGGQNYALQFSQNGWKVAYLSTFLSPFKLIGAKDKEFISKQWQNFAQRGENINENLWSFVPFTLLPHHNNSFLDTNWLMNNYHRFSPVNYVKLLEKKGFYSGIDVLWIDSPHLKFWKDLVKPKKTIYRVTDNLQGFKYLGKNVLRAEEKAIEISDITVVASRILTDKLQKKNPGKNIAYCPNGTNLDNFVKDSYCFPADLVGIPGKKALYVGAIGEWFDIDLLHYLADRSPDTSFIIIGHDRRGIFSGNTRKNIYHLGRKKYTEVPDYIFNCDFGIIPFAGFAIVQTIHPIKMYEFFCLGKPVISTSWEELRLLDSPCHLASTKEEFAELINSGAVMNSLTPQSLVDYAVKNSWFSRYKFVLELLSGAPG